LLYESIDEYCIDNCTGFDTKRKFREAGMAYFSMHNSANDMKEHITHGEIKGNKIEQI
jgi:hypothetical protein